MSYLIYQHILKFYWVGWDGVGSGGGVMGMLCVDGEGYWIGVELGDGLVGG